MGLEQLAAIRGLLAKQTRDAAAPKKPARNPTPARAGSPAAERGDTAVDPVLIAISRLQRRFPNAFPKKPAPKVPLKVGVLEDLAQQAKVLQLSADEIKQAVKTWCDGRRYWDCMVEAAARVDLNGEPAGAVTASEAQHAKRMASRRHGKGAGASSKSRAKPDRKAADGAKPAQAEAAASVVDASAETSMDTSVDTSAQPTTADSSADSPRAAE